MQFMTILEKKKRNLALHHARPKGKSGDIPAQRNHLAYPAKKC